MNAYANIYRRMTRYLKNSAYLCGIIIKRTSYDRLLQQVLDAETGGAWVRRTGRERNFAEAIGVKNIILPREFVEIIQKL